jgi:U3 small nucleolar RNA-associated protein 18
MHAPSSHAGSDGILYTWDLRMRRCLSQQVDEGNFNTSCLAAAADGGYLATGSTAGVVNLYNSSSSKVDGSSSSRLLRPSSLPPLKSLMNLTTTVDSLAFNHDSQLLAMGSRMKKDSLRLVHLPSMTVFSNWPTSKTPLHYVHSLAFSPSSGYLALGNAKGRVLLYRLHHFGSA